jgi:NhaP-type Na+/H+ or K+/H+ antiporter
MAIYAVLSLTVVRMAPVALALLGTRTSRPTVLFMGWFGPRGLASIVFVVLVLDGSDLDHVDTLVATGVITVALSVYAHGLTAVPLTTAYVKWFAAQPRAPEAESRPVHEQPLRRSGG